jgi:hypothetical protein
VQVSPQLADRVDANLVAEGLEHVEIGVGAALDSPAVAEHLDGQLVRGPALADPGRAVEQVGVRDPVA